MRCQSVCIGLCDEACYSSSESDQDNDWQVTGQLKCGTVYGESEQEPKNGPT